MRNEPTTANVDPLRGTVQVSRQLKRQIERLQAKKATPSPAEAARRRISKG